MSTKEEERRALAMVRRFLYDLLNPSATPRVPREIRERARRVVKHYPLMAEYKWGNGA